MQDWRGAPPPAVSTPAAHLLHPGGGGGSPSTAELLRAAHSGSTAQLGRQLQAGFQQQGAGRDGLRGVTFAPAPGASSASYAMAILNEHTISIKEECYGLGKPV